MEDSLRPALFVYVPFCASVCTYCDFNVYARREGEFDAYVDAVAREIELVADGLGVGERGKRKARTLALGGGTPSILSAAQLEVIVEKARELFEFENGAEWMLEANPGTVDLEKLRAVKEMGFNRLSLGVQTFDDARLVQFNRVHTVRESYEAFELARKAGFGNLNIDLIYGLPEQTIENWRETLGGALEFGSEHLSLYGLQVEDRTVLKKQIELGRVAKPDPDLAADMYEMAVERLGGAGYVHYEISNFAKPGYESQHNKTYWLNEPYLGFGAGAHSLWRGERYENVRNPREYVRATEDPSFLRAGSGPRTNERERDGEIEGLREREEKGAANVHRKWVSSSERIGREMEMAETMFLGLRLAEGVSWKRFAQRFGVDARVVYAEAIEKIRGLGFLVTDERGMRLTEGGMLVSNQLLWRFLPD